MKRITFLLIGLALATSPHTLRAQDAATEERLNKVNGLVQDLVEDKANTKKQLDAMAKEIQALREQAGSASAAASAEDLKRLAEKMQEIDRKREADKELILGELEKLGKALKESRTRVALSPSSSGGSSTPAERGYEYVVQTGDTLSAIVGAYREEGVKVTVDDILRANPGLKPTSLTVGKKIFIPATTR